MASFRYTNIEGLLGASTAFNMNTIIGGKCYSGFLANDATTTATTFGVQFSYDAGTSFGSTITVRGTEQLAFNGFGPIDQVKLVYGGASTNYRLIVSGDATKVS